MNFANLAKGKILAAVPFYASNSQNMTRIYYSDKIIDYNRTIKTFEKNLCKYYFLDRAEEKLFIAKEYNIKNNIPLIVPGTLYIQIKVRKTLGPNDGAYAFINFGEISHIKGRENCTIVLSNKVEIDTVVSKRIIDKYIRIGKKINLHLREKSTRLKALC